MCRLFVDNARLRAIMVVKILEKDVFTLDFAAKKHSAVTALRIINGILLLLGAILLCALPLSTGTTYTQIVASLGPSYESHYSLILYYVRIAYPFISCVTAFVSTITAMLLFQNHRYAKRMAISSAVLQLLSAVYALLAPILITLLFLPTINSPELVGALLLYHGIELLQAFPQALVSLLLLAVTVFYGVFAKKGLPVRFERKDCRRLVGLIILAVTLPLFSEFYTYFTKEFVSYCFGMNVLSCQLLIAQLINQIPLWMFVLAFFAICMATHKHSYILSAVIVTPLVAIIGGAAFTIQRICMPLKDYPDVISSMVASSYTVYAIVTILFVVGIYFWISSTARGHIPIPVQILLAASLFLLSPIIPIITTLTALLASEWLGLAPLFPAIAITVIPVLCTFIAFLRSKKQPTQ